MSLLVRVFASMGFLTGVGAAALWHWARVSTNVGWTLYAPLNGPPRLPMQHPAWWPTLVLFPVVGAIAGALIGLGLGRLGWAMVRNEERDIS